MTYTLQFDYWWYTLKKIFKDRNYKLYHKTVIPFPEHKLLILYISIGTFVKHMKMFVVKIFGHLGKQEVEYTPRFANSASWWRNFLLKPKLSQISMFQSWNSGRKIENACFKKWDTWNKRQVDFTSFRVSSAHWLKPAPSTQTLQKIVSNNSFTKEPWRQETNRIT